MKKDRIERGERREYGCAQFPKGFITLEINNKLKGRDWYNSYKQRELIREDYC